MLLALDVGNTNITLGVYEGEKLLFVTRMATNPPRMEDEYASAMLSILHLYNIHTSQVNGAVLSSVVPRLTDDLARAVRRVWKVEPFIVSAQSVPTSSCMPATSSAPPHSTILSPAAPTSLSVLWRQKPCTTARVSSSIWVRQRR